MRPGLLHANASLLEAFVRLADPLLVILAGVLAYRACDPGTDLPEHNLLALIGMAVTCVALFPLFRIYSPQRGVTLFAEVGRLAQAWAVMAALWFTYVFASRTGAEFSRVWSALWIGFGVAAHIVFRAGIRFVLREARRRGYNLRHVVIVGAGDLGRDIAHRIAQTPWSGLVARAFYDDDPALAGTSVENIPVAGTTRDIARHLDLAPIDQVYIALPLRADTQIRELLRDLGRHPVEVKLVPDIFSFTLLNHSFTELAGLPVINLNASPLTGVNRALKRVEDLLLATVLLAITLPVMAAIALGVRISSPGPALYRQKRVTWNGVRFAMLKFRTMPRDAEITTGPVWTRSGEPRATPFGAFLRRYSLDELPQLINVLKGEMSLVGPRPERPEFVEQFRTRIPGYMQKHLVKAGITGWAQVNDLRGDSDLAHRIQYDLYYVDHWSLWFDLRIILLTVLHIFRSRNAG